MSVPKSELDVILTFASTLLWPVTVLIAFVIFHRNIRALLDRVSSLKIAGVEFAYQAPSPDSNKATPIDDANVIRDGRETFLTETGIRAAVREGGNLSPTDEIYRTMRIFSTTDQTSWLAFSKEKVILLLDDVSTRASGKLIQWILAKNQATPIVARPRSPGVGLLDIGPRSNWLYSTNLFSTPAYLKGEIESALREGA